MTQVIYRKQLERSVTMTVTLREDKKYTISFIGGGNVFSFTTDQIGPVSERLKGLNDSLEWDNYFENMDNSIDIDF